MSASEDDPSPTTEQGAGDGVLSRLPRTRPQRSSPRREGARGRTPARSSSKTGPDSTAKTGSAARSRAKASTPKAGSRPKAVAAAPAPGAKAAAGAGRPAAKATAAAKAPKAASAAGAAAAAAAKAAPAESGETVRPRKPKGTRPSAARQRAHKSAARSAPTPEPDQVPRQGWESEGERMTGSVEPPSGSEFLASALEIAGEAAKAGFAGGERLVRDLFSRLPGA